MICRIVSVLFVIGFLPSSFLSAQEPPEIREWKSSDGKYTVVASLIRKNGGNVELRRKDNGKVLIVPLNRLSTADVRYLRSLSRKPANSKKGSVTPPKSSSGLNTNSTAAKSDAGNVEWLQWRGPSRNGYAPESEKPPTEWSSSKNILWKTPVPGSGHSSPILFNDQIFLTTADNSRQTQSVLCFDRISGKQVWSKVIHQGNFTGKIHKKNTHASPTLACDKQHLYALFNNRQSVFLTKLDLKGEIVWQKNLGGFDTKYPFGFAPSPTLYENMVIVSAESKVGFLTALDKQTGNPIWKNDRRKSSYSSPIVANVGGKDQILLSGGSAVSGFDPKTGRSNWSAPAVWEVSCATLVWGDGKVFSSGGYPRPQTLCVAADGSGRIIWQNNIKCYEQSMLYHDGYLYGIDDNGIGHCWRGEDGNEMWKQRLEGPVSSSPMLVNGNIHYASERGTTYVFKANPQKFELVAKNKLGDSAFATPAYCENRIYTRVGFAQGRGLQEYLICIGE